MTFFARKSLISYGCGIVLTTGLIVILILLTGPFVPYLPGEIQTRIPSFIFILLLLTVTPILVRNLNRQDDLEKILGWTFIGLGVEFIAFPLSLFFIIQSAASIGLLMVTVMLVTFSVVFGIPAGLMSIGLGIFLLKNHHHFNPSKG